MSVWAGTHIVFNKISKSVIETLCYVQPSCRPNRRTFSTEQRSGTSNFVVWNVLSKCARFGCRGRSFDALFLLVLTYSFLSGCKSSIFWCASSEATEDCFYAPKRQKYALSTELSETFSTFVCCRRASTICHVVHWSRWSTFYWLFYCSIEECSQDDISQTPSFFYRTFVFLLRSPGPHI